MTNYLALGKIKCLEKLNESLMINKSQYKTHKKILLLFSGGLDTSFLLKYFITEIDSKIVALAFDLGGERVEINSLRKKALRLGANKFLLLDAKKRFVQNYCLKAIKANAIFGGAHPLSSSLSRPIMAELAIRVARRYKCTAIMHGANGWQNNSARFDTAIRVLAPEIDIIEPIMEWGVKREFEQKYLAAQGVKIYLKEDSLLSSDNNIWGREVEDGALKKSFSIPSNNIYHITQAPEQAPNRPYFSNIEFAHGIPIKLNGRALKPLKLIEKLNALGGKHGVGRHDAMEDKVIGYKAREIHESPAATILIKTHSDLETFILPKKTLRIKKFLDQEWLELACFGNWHHPLRETLEKFIDHTNKKVSGVVRLKLYKGSVNIVGRKSPNGLDEQRVVASARKTFRQNPYPTRSFYDYYAYEAIASAHTPAGCGARR